MTSLPLTDPTFTVTGPEGAFSAETSEQAWALKHRLGSAYKVNTVPGTPVAWKAEATVCLKATEKGMKRNSDFFDPEEHLVVDKDMAERLGKGEVIVEWSDAMPTLNHDIDCDLGPIQWVYVWAWSEEAATRKIKSLVRAREKQLMGCYEPVIGVVDVKLIKGAVIEPAGPVQPSMPLV